MQITLYFADFNASAIGQRVFNIQISGQQTATGVDVYALGGGNYSAVSVAAPAFYSGSRSNFDIALPTVVSYTALELQLLCLCPSWAPLRPLQHALQHHEYAYPLPLNGCSFLVLLSSAKHHITMSGVHMPSIGYQRAVHLQPIPSS